MADEKDNTGEELSEEEIQRLKSAENKLEKMLDSFKDREKQLSEYENKLRDRELEWERKKKEEEDRWRKELLEREKEIEKREKELEMRRLFDEERQLEERERILREMEEEIEKRHEKLISMKRELGVDKAGGIRMFTSMIRDKLKDFNVSNIALVVTPPNQHGDIALAIAEILSEEWERNGVYITFSRPYEQITRDFEEQKINGERVIFIDCVSKMAGRFPGKKENAVFIDNPSSLEEVGMYSDKILSRMPEPKFFILDSTSSMSIYNDKTSVREFIHFLINKMRLDKIGGIILTVEKEGMEEVIEALQPLVDAVIRI